MEIEVKDLQEQLSKRKGYTVQDAPQSLGASATTPHDENDPDMRLFYDTQVLQ
jgi:hypothetical protein